MRILSDLPITAALPELRAALARRDDALLIAPPGAGKTTQVPLQLLNEPWCAGKILMFEPRRMAARAAAVRMAELLGEAVGATVGFRIRGETKVSQQTRIEVVTGGVLTRLLLDNPGLDGVSLVILDEFHERNVDADLSLSLILAGREWFGEGRRLKLLLMSATLDAEPVAALVDADLVRSDGRAFPVEITHLAAPSYADLLPATAAAVARAAAETNGHILVFLPGQKEILALKALLQPAMEDRFVLLPLYGALPFSEQQRALAPQPESAGQKRKLVLTTDIAETSLTIPGVTAVVDTGFHRTPRFDARTGMTRLATERISRASATQRSGRAGRTAPGRCYRLWPQEQALNSASPPEILQADLAPLALQLCAYGIDSPSELTWLTPPPAKHYAQAQALLASLGALQGNQLSAHGKAMLGINAHPRLAHMLLKAHQHGVAERGSWLAALLHENIRGDNADLEHTLLHPERLPGLAKRAQQQFLLALTSNKTNAQGALCAGELLAFAYPDRIARKVAGSESLYRLSNGRQAVLGRGSPLARHTWLVAAEVGGSTGSSEDTIFSGAGLPEGCFSGSLAELTHTTTRAYWSENEDRFIAETVTQVGKLDIKSQTLPSPDPDVRAQAVAAYVSRHNLTPLQVNDEVLQLCARVELAREHLPEFAWPNFSAAALTATVTEWLTPYLLNVRTAAELKKIDLHRVLSAKLDWSQQNTLDELLPHRISVPSGSSIALDYTQAPPVLAVKLQEMFGVAQTPTVCRGSVRLMIHLLSPAGRPLQVTQDLASFWQTGYQEVKKEMKGRYPKHPWPDNPLTAVATRFTKKRFEQQ